MSAFSVGRSALFGGATPTARLNRGRFFVLCAVLDAAISAVALVIARAADWFDRPATLAGAFVIAFLMVGGVATKQSMRRLRPSFYDDLASITSAATLAIVLGLLAQELLADRPTPGGGPLLAFGALEVGALVVGHGVAKALGARLVPPVPTLIVGAGRVGRLLGQRLLDQPHLGLTPIGFLDKNPREPEALGPGAVLPVLGASWDLEDIVQTHGVGYVVVTFSTAPTEVLLSLLRRCEKLGIDVALVPRLFERVPRRVAVHHLGAVPLLQVHPANPRGLAFELKHVIDRVCAGILVPILAPALVLSAVGVYASLGRPILFRQRRIGRDGKPFDMLKFRTMAADPGGRNATVQYEEGLAPGGVEGQDRRTRVGAILRRTSLDELPQILNVLKGEMSFVGPRPERPEFVEIFNDDVYRYDERHRVKAGITGWSQVNGLRGKTSIRDRAEWDNYYIENWSFAMDLRILASTVRAMFAPGSTE